MSIEHLFCSILTVNNHVLLHLSIAFILLFQRSSICYVSHYSCSEMLLRSISGSAHSDLFSISGTGKDVQEQPQIQIVYLYVGSHRL